MTKRLPFLQPNLWLSDANADPMLIDDPIMIHVDL